MSFLRILPQLAPLVFTTGCVYRFTNDHVRRPEGIRTIAIEAVYDTTREVVPHELLWASLQEAFATDGHLTLVPQSEADALVRAHLKDASVGASGSVSPNSNLKDPVTDITAPDLGAPPSPRKWRKLTQAGEIKDRGAVAFAVDVEVWSLRTRALLMRQTYALSGGFFAVHSNGSGNPDTSVTTRANDYLRYEESMEARFKQLSGDLAQRVVKDLLVQ